MYFEELYFGVSLLHQIRRKALIVRHTPLCFQEQARASNKLILSGIPEWFRDKSFKNIGTPWRHRPQPRSVLIMKKFWTLISFCNYIPLWIQFWHPDNISEFSVNLCKFYGSSGFIVDPPSLTFCWIVGAVAKFKKISENCQWHFCRLKSEL